MKRQLKIFLLAGATVLTASAQDKFDAYSYMILDTYQRAMANPEIKADLVPYMPFDISEVRSRGEAESSIIITLNEGYTADDIEALGFEVVSVLDEIVVARGLVSDIMALPEHDCVKSLSFGRLREVMMNNTREVTGGQAVQDGTGLPKKYTGAGVIAGIWDTGMEPNHVNFLDSKGNSRINRFWWFTGNGQFSEYTNANIASVTTDDREGTHGTHTMGCMAGSWNGRGGGGYAVPTAAKWSVTGSNPFYGMAPGAEIAAGAGMLYDSNTIAAVTNIANYATSVNKPFVVNLSIGSNDGPHDGSDAIGQALTKVAQRGGLVFVSAGNEGQDNISVQKTFSGSDTSVATFVQATGLANGNYSFWSNSSEPFTLTVLVYNRQTNKIEYSYDFGPTGGSNSYRLGFGGITDAAFSSAFVGSSSYVSLSRSTNSGTNNRYGVSGYITLTVNSEKNPRGENYALGFKVTGKSGQRVDINAGLGTYTPFTSFGVPGYVDGTPDFSINDVASGPDVIAVGSWNSRISFPTKSGMATAGSFTQNGISPFSSYGTTFDGRKLPEICTPGINIISSISSYYYASLSDRDKEYISGQQKTPNTYAINPGQENYWYSMSGTSMASPIAAGAICLWLEANPYLTLADVREIFKNTNITTGLVAANPQARWGGGKLDVLNGLKAVLNLGSVNDIAVDKDNLLFTPKGNNEWEVFVAGAKSVNADIYSLSGVMVGSVASDGDTVTINADNLEKGIYVVTVNGANAERIAVR